MALKGYFVDLRAGVFILRDNPKHHQRAWFVLTQRMTYFFGGRYVELPFPPYSFHRNHP